MTFANFAPQACIQILPKWDGCTKAAGFCVAKSGTFRRFIIVFGISSCEKSHSVTEKPDFMSNFGFYLPIPYMPSDLL